MFYSLLSFVAVLFLPTTDGFSHEGFPQERFLMRLWDLFPLFTLLLLWFTDRYMQSSAASAGMLLQAKRSLKQWECWKCQVYGRT